jgi:hypothetical protein
MRTNFSKEPAVSVIYPDERRQQIALYHRYTPSDLRGDSYKRTVMSSLIAYGRVLTYVVNSAVILGDRMTYVHACSFNVFAFMLAT